MADKEENILYNFDLKNNDAADPGFGVNADDIPYVDWMPGLRLKVLAADTEAARFVVRILFKPGVQLPPHMHTGTVHAFTNSGKWTYLEYDSGQDCTAGSYLSEPAGSVHTLKVADDNAEVTDVSFIVEGAMIHLNPDGSVMDIADAGTHIRDYAAACKEQGFDVPEIILGGSTRLGPAK
ncbi:MAG: 2,4'-dihydroxyacetophenone dioxygenase family protein [Gammaproteobacteria bacterium]|jgi:2,4'-dihydroxyacetophenone dioxygenase|nr:2,4'-dihydroxyacetophenone dioxygenase family protein [Gammaproteobacteria bacterium]